MTTVVNKHHGVPYNVYIGRPSPFGNPFTHMAGYSAAKYRCTTREESIEKFREWFLAQPDLVERARRDLKGKVLACWCAPLPCHGHVIAEIIDADPE